MNMTSDHVTKESNEAKESKVKTLNLGIAQVNRSFD